MKFGLQVLDNVEKKRSAFGLDEEEEDIASTAKKMKTEQEGNASKPEESLTVDGLMQKTPSDKLSVRQGSTLNQSILNQ